MILSLYSGSLVHAVAQELVRGVEPETLLTESSFAVELYRNLQAMLELELDDQFIMRIRTRAGPRGQRARCDPANELSKMFQHLTTDEEKDEEKDEGCDMFYEETCSARTRHRSRAHMVDPRAKKYERVKWG